MLLINQAFIIGLGLKYIVAQSAGIIILSNELSQKNEADLNNISMGTYIFCIGFGIVLLRRIL